MYSLEQVTAAVKKSWSAYTAYDASDWSPENPARGQCVVSALIIQDILGGTLQKTKVSFNGKEESHYRNILPDGRLVDVTRSQYPKDQVLTPSDINLEGFGTLRDKLFSEASTEKRYKLLRTQVLRELA